jgi:dienelactone hydrolase
MYSSLFFIIVFALFNCSESKKTTIQTSQKTFKPISKRQDSIPKTLVTCDSLKSFQTIEVGGRKIDIAVPNGAIKGNLLILQGFAFPKDDWCKKSSLCKKALAEGYVLIMPEMGKSNYMSRIYPETRADWRKEPQKAWLTDSVFQVLQKKYCLLLPNQKNYMIGLSTGARGVAVVALEHPTLFKAVAALSGDYDQSKIPQDRVHIGYMGAYQKFPKRWSEEENIVFQIAKWKTPIYLGHGKLDNVCPASQTKLFYDALQKNHPNLRVKLSMPANHTHDYKYWDWEVDNVLSFFREF